MDMDMDACGGGGVSQKLSMLCRVEELELEGDSRLSL